jgi:hypothetical protein
VSFGVILLKNGKSNIHNFLVKSTKKILKVHLFLKNNSWGIFEFFGQERIEPGL